MTFYAYDPGRAALLATWSAGVGNIAQTVAELPEPVDTEQVLHLTDRLTGLSRAAWRTYTHPASAAESLEANTEGWLREGEREAFGSVAAAIRQPHLPEDGELLQSYIEVEERAHQVGRALHAIGVPAFAESVIADVQAELAAIEQAERGDLTGRARQAVELTRADASPLQVAAADTLLRDHPLGSDALFTQVDPTAASVAAAHWLLAAAEVASAVSGTDPTMVVAEADNIEAIAVETPTLVLDRLVDGDSPREVVLKLVGDAMAVAEGQIPDLAGLLTEIVAANEQAEQFEDDDEDVGEVLVPDRITPLDPARPAQDLLEDLLGGIHGCWLLYREHAAEAAAEGDDEWSERADEAFFTAVRTAAAARPGPM